MKQTTLLAALLVWGGASLFAADPQLLNMALPNAQMYAGINVEQAKTSQFGQFLLANLPVDPGFLQFVETSGFDPRRDLREILITTAFNPAAAPLADPSAASPEQLAHPFNGLLLAKGTFNIPQITALAAKDGKTTSSTYAGAQLISMTGESSEAVAFIDSSTAIAGSLDAVKAALDRRNSSNAIDAVTMARINELSTTEDAWSVSSANFGSLLPGAHGKLDSTSAVLQGVKQASGGVKFGANVQLNGQAIAKDAQDASSLGDVIKLLAQMLQVHSSNGGAPAQVTDLLKSMTVTTDGNIVNVSLTLPEAQLETLFKMAEAHHEGPRKI